MGGAEYRRDTAPHNNMFEPHKSYIGLQGKDWSISL